MDSRSPVDAAVARPPLLAVRDLRTNFPTRKGLIRAVDGVTFDLQPSDTLGIVGESGCGKSVTALSLVGLIPPPGRIASGEVWFEGQNLASASEGALRRVRGGRIGFVFQDPMVAFNPVMSIGDQIVESIRVHTDLGGTAARARAVDLLDLVGIPDAERRVRNYPHEFSGGMRQRAMIAIGIACRPALLIADEPTTALDVTIQAQILDLIKDLQRTLGMALILITHDLGVVTEMCRRVLVMYAGRMAELSDTVRLYGDAAHPYTRGLLASRPGADESWRGRDGSVGLAEVAATGATLRGRRPRLRSIPGLPPDLATPLVGCAYAPRCELADERCRQTAPAFDQVGTDHHAACWAIKREPTHVS
jgi:oligopeptide/dipeptide ABC transporter ATP-binding protein